MTISFWNKEYLALIRLISNLFPATKEIAELFSCVSTEIRETVVTPEGFDKLGSEDQQKYIDKLREEYNPALFTAAENRYLNDLVLRFSLGDEQQRLIVIFFLYDRYTPFQNWFSKQNESMCVKLMEEFTGFGRNALIESMKSNDSLTSFGILDPDCMPPLTINRYNIRTSIAQYVSYYLDDTHNRTLSSFVLDVRTTGDLPISAFDLPDTTIGTCLALLKKPGRGIILLYGEPGTGKTEFSKCICAESKKRSCFLKTPNAMRRFSMMRMAAKLVLPDDEVLVIDEAESLLFATAASGEKAMLTQFLDEYDKKLILIVNELSGIGDFILRRIDVFISFLPFTASQRERVWNRVDQEYPVFKPSERVRLALEFPSNPSRIKQVRDICSILAQDGMPGEVIEESARDLLSRGIEAMNGYPFRQDTISPEIDLSLISASVPAGELADRIGRWNQSKDDKRSGLNILFYGAPGTGKTVLARYLARSIGCVPVVRRASDLLGPYVGMTERQIREAFDEAKDGCLIIDEADSFLTERSTAVRTWERTQVNEFLTCMERFSGLFIATTNFTVLLDGASRRRFQYKVEFRPSTAEAKRALALRFFPDQDWNETTLDRVSCIEGLTPGDFSAVSCRLRYADKPTAGTVCAELESEVGFEMQQHRIGFNE